MAHGAGFHLLCGLGGLLALGASAAAAPVVGAAPAGFSAPSPRMAPRGSMLAQQQRAIRPLHGHRRHGGYGYGGYGFYDGRAYPQVLVVLPEEREEPKQEAVPTVVGIQRPPVADPVIYRIEGRKGRQVARVIRLGADGASPVSGGPHIIPIDRR
jgi:hypothetical protein